MKKIEKFFRPDPADQKLREMGFKQRGLPGEWRAHDCTVRIFTDHVASQIFIELPNGAMMAFRAAAKAVGMKTAAEVREMDEKILAEEKA